MDWFEVALAAAGAVCFLVFALMTNKEQRELRRKVWQLEEKLVQLESERCQCADDRGDRLDRVVSG